MVQFLCLTLKIQYSCDWFFSKICNRACSDRISDTGERCAAADSYQNDLSVLRTSAGMSSFVDAEEPLNMSASRHGGRHGPRGTRCSPPPLPWQSIVQRHDEAVCNAVENIVLQFAKLSSQCSADSYNTTAGMKTSSVKTFLCKRLFLKKACVQWVPERVVEYEGWYGTGSRIRLTFR